MFTLRGLLFTALTACAFYWLSPYAEIWTLVIAHIIGYVWGYSEHLVGWAVQITRYKYILPRENTEEIPPVSKD